MSGRGIISLPVNFDSTEIGRRNRGGSQNDGDIGNMFKREDNFMSDDNIVDINSNAGDIDDNVGDEDSDFMEILGDLEVEEPRNDISVSEGVTEVVDDSESEEHEEREGGAPVVMEDDSAGNFSSDNFITSNLSNRFTTDTVGDTLIPGLDLSMEGGEDPDYDDPNGGVFMDDNIDNSDVVADVPANDEPAVARGGEGPFLIGGTAIDIREVSVPIYGDSEIAPEPVANLEIESVDMMTAYLIDVANRALSSDDFAAGLVNVSNHFYINFTVNSGEEQVGGFLARDVSGGFFDEGTIDFGC